MIFSSDEFLSKYGLFSSSCFINPYPLSTFFVGNQYSQWFFDILVFHLVILHLVNLNISNEYKGSNQHQVNNCQGLQISHMIMTSIVSSHCHLHSYNILHVPSITKKFLYIKKFTTDNSCFPFFENLVVNIFFVKTIQKT